MLKDFFKRYLVYIIVFVVLIGAGIKLFNPSTELKEVDDSKVNLYFFYGDGCPHCAKEEEFLDKLEEKYEQIEVHRYETWYDRENAALLDKVRSKLGFKTGVPVLIVGEESIVGYSSYEISGKKIEGIVSKYIENNQLTETLLDQNKTIPEWMYIVIKNILKGKNTYD